MVEKSSKNHNELAQNRSTLPDKVCEEFFVVFNTLP